MSTVELTIPAMAYDAAAVICPPSARDAINTMLQVAAPLIVAAELRRMADVLYELSLITIDEDYDTSAYRYARSVGHAVSASRLRGRADELDGGAR